MRSFKDLLSKLNLSITRPRASVAQLIELESEIGGSVFGPLPAGISRRFFMDTENEWFFSESAIDANGHKRSYTIRYQVLPTGVLKSVDGRGHTFIEGRELQDLLQATKTYQQRINQRIYSKYTTPTAA